jgi:hypothetical protein
VLAGVRAGRHGVICGMLRSSMRGASAATGSAHYTVDAHLVHWLGCMLGVLQGSYVQSTMHPGVGVCLLQGPGCMHRTPKTRRSRWDAATV